jgi:flagellar basal-body rod protein FlgC
MLDIPTSGLVAQRTRHDVIASNVANVRTLENAQGEYEPFRRRLAVFAPGDGKGGGGVHVKEILIDQGPLVKRYEPGSPYADESGYVEYPNVDLVTERVNALEASRAYEANITAIEATKSMISSALRIIA